MGSRTRDNVSHLFECFCEVVKPQPGVSEAWIIQKFPEKYKDEEVLKSVSKFSYPCEFDNSVVQHYSFVLTSADSKWTFGFCRHDPKSETALVLLSFLPWHEVFYKLLNHISDLTHSSKTDFLWPFLTTVYSSKVPEQGTSLSVPLNNETSTVFVCQAPNQFQLPSIPENRNLTEYYNAVDCDNMILIFASMLYERRIIFTSKKLYRLSACVQAANAVIYPMNWQHIFIPVLPLPLIDYLLAPMPYLIGVPNILLNKIRKSDIGDVVILDADNNTVQSPFDDLASLPQDVVKLLKSQLKNRAGLLGEGVSRAFLRALVQLIGGYRDALKFHQGEKITFDSDSFVESRPLNMQPFLRKMLELQIFQQFIEERLSMLNAGLGFSDEFELEACNYCDKTSSRLKAQYKDWAYNMKREGTAFFKGVKTRANPAVKSAVKTVKERGKDVGKAYKGIRSKLRDLGDDKRPRTSSGFLTNATTSYIKDFGNVKQKKITGPEISRSQAPYCALTPSSPDNPGETSGLQLSPLDMDLMGDLQDVLFRKCSLLEPPTETFECDEKIKPVRSLENFGSDHTNITDELGATGVDNVFLVGSRTNLGKVHSKQTDKLVTQDLIRLDSTPSDSESETGIGIQMIENGVHSLLNPLYPYFKDEENRGGGDLSKTCSGSNRSESSSWKVGHRAAENDLLKEYGLDFDSFSLQPSTAPPALSKSEWTRFD